MKKSTKVYIIGIIIPLVVGGLSALITSGSMDIYKDIVRPPLSPPGILFPIVWTILFVLMGVGSAMVYNSDNVSFQKRKNALYVYLVQLALNFFWNIIFFNMREYLFSFIWLVALLALIILMIYKFYKINKTAALLQMPYLLWVSFAGYLNLAIYILN